MLKLPTLPRGIALTDSKGLPSVQFQTWWQSVTRAIEAQETRQDAIIADIVALQEQQQEQLDAILAVQAAADAANAAAEAANAAAEAAAEAAADANSAVGVLDTAVTELDARVSALEP
jgi:hypothetical protein